MSYQPLYYDDSALDHRQRVKEFVHEFPNKAKDYLYSLFPIISWLPRYNRTWFYGDIIAAITIGCVVVPQGMAYAKIATLPVQYGLYSSFTGVFIYCFFATSKDITIGPVAVMSLLLGEILAEMKIEHPEISPIAISSALALLAGLVTLGVGLLRLGFIIDFISGPSIAGFMSGSALTILIGQIPGLLGIPNINTRKAAYLVLGNTLKALGNAKADSGFGVVILVLLYTIRYGSEYLSKSYPKYKKPLFFFNTSRSVLMVIISTIIAFLISKDDPSNPPIKVLGTVPSGLHGIGVPSLDSDLVGGVISKLPVVVLVLVLEHVAIAKSFGRLSDYVVNPNQEFIAIGVANIVGSFFSSYPATGSFSRTAIKAKAGVRSPIAGVYSGAIVLLAIYVLTPAFFYIPSACLSAVIIHAVADLFSGPKAWKQFWKVSAFELLVFALGVIITFFTTVEDGIYASVGFSLFLLLQRIARPRFSVLGRVPIPYPSTNTGEEEKGNDGKADKVDVEKFLYVPMEHESLKSKSDVLPMPPGVVVVRLEEAYTYPNASFITDKIIEAAKAATKRGGAPLPNGERPWNDPYDEKEMKMKESLPLLKAVVIDFIAVNYFDATGLQGLMSARSTLDRYTGKSVEWHFANISNAKIRRALFVGGFGFKVSETEPIAIVPTLNNTEPNTNDNDMIEMSTNPSHSVDVENQDHVSVVFIHFDLDSAILSASRDD